VSGDKFLGALLDVGEASGEFTVQDLRAIVVALAPEASVEVTRVLSHGISALSIEVSAQGDASHRHWSDIRELIAAAHASPAAVRESALRAFGALAEAEAGVHGVELDRVHFHEVGAIDSIADIVGVCAGIHALGIDRLVVSPVAVGSGTVDTSHGVLPVPAPATATLLRGVPIVAGVASGELTTPTGATLVSTLAVEFSAPPAMTLFATGYGAGTRDIGVPNVCQLLLGEASPATSPHTERVVLLETNIDHLPAEELAFAAQQLLLSHGALDVWQTPIVMKKGRAATMLSVLAAPAESRTLAERIIELTGSLGVRQQTLERSCVPREVRSIDTPWGAARVKVGAGRVRPEHDDVARIAAEHALSYADVARQIAELGREQDSARSK
jgi:uncharacterized protein (TIGR00299 family) protein